MSKIGKKNIAIPAGVDVKIDGQKVSVKWPKWELFYTLVDGVKAEIKDNEIAFSIDNDEKKNLRGLSRTLVNNMVEGVTHGYEKKLLLMWVWFTAKKEWTWLVLALGFSYKVKFDVPTGIKCEVEQDAKGNYVITMHGIDKQLLGQKAAQLKALKVPEPYKGKWFRYFDEFIKLKPGKAAKKA